MTKQIIYIAGPLFTEYESKQRLKEGKKIRKLLDSLKLQYEIGNPIEFPINPKPGENQPEPNVIFQKDFDFIQKANVFFVDLANNDIGTYMELGIIIQRIKNNKSKSIKLFSIHSDFRILSNSRLGYKSTFGLNSFVIGGILKSGFKIYSSFDEALIDYKQNIIYNK